MTDTPSHIYQIQYNIIAAKPIAERVRLGIDTIDSMRKMIKNSLLQQNPTLDNASIEMLLFKHYYSGDFPEVLLNKIAQSIYDYHAKKSAIFVEKFISQ
ncbi:MAG: hypothetical protein RLZZ292_1270 [Bacteroidota bacterium]|jgi:hypothetical protein